MKIINRTSSFSIVGAFGVVFDLIQVLTEQHSFRKQWRSSSLVIRRRIMHSRSLLYAYRTQKDAMLTCIWVKYYVPA